MTLQPFRAPALLCFALHCIVSFIYRLYIAYDVAYDLLGYESIDGLLTCGFSLQVGRLLFLFWMFLVSK